MTRVPPTPSDTTPLQPALSADGSLPQLLLAWRRTSDTTTPTFRVERVELAQNVSEQFLGYAAAAAETVDGGSPIHYDPEYTLRVGEYFALAQTEWPARDFFDQVDDFLNLGRFTRKKLTKPRLYVVAVQTPSGNAFFGKSMSALKVLSSGANLVTAIWDGSTFSALTDSVATFSASFDWVVWQDMLYVLNAAGFHAVFRDNDALMKSVSNHVAAITSGTLKIRNTDALIRRCQASVPMAAKLKRIADHGIQTYDLSLLKTYTDDFAIPVTWDGDTLIYNDSFEAQWSVLILLDEDRTEGPVSKRKYESSSKRDIDAGS